jgi:hypothetical protein
MSEINEIKFECYLCGGTELEYQKYVKCTMPVKIQDGQVVYGTSTIDEEDDLAALNGFACKSCGDKLEHSGYRIETEKELITYLAIPLEVRQQEQKEYEETICAQISAQEMEKQENEHYYESDDSELFVA